MTQIWGWLFGINFAHGRGHRITMEFQSAQLAYYSQLRPATFSACRWRLRAWSRSLGINLRRPVLLGGIDCRSSPICQTALVALGSSLSALWILIANGWMQAPVGARSTFTQRMELSSFGEVLFNPVAPGEVSSYGSPRYCDGLVFVLGISAWYLLRGRMSTSPGVPWRWAASFGLAAPYPSSFSAMTGYLDGENQKMKVALEEASGKPNARRELYRLRPARVAAARRTPTMNSLGRLF